jgi:hypothetical protein
MELYINDSENGLFIWENIFKNYGKNIKHETILTSVADPDPDPPDPHVFGPPGSGSTSQRYGSGSFYHHAKIVRKTLISTILLLFLTFYL